MINRIISFSIKNKLIIGLMTLTLIATGIWAMYTVNLGAVPDITSNQVQVITVSPNLSTTDVEQFITYPIELALANLPGVKSIRSVSRFGLSVVTVVFKDKMGTYLPRQLVQTKLNEVEEKIPNKLGSPSMGPITTGLGEIFQYTLQPKPGYEEEYSLRELRTIQDWIIARQMALVPGVVGVNAFGGKIKQYEVAIDPGKLNAMNISISEVFRALKKNNANTGGAYIEKNNMANFIRGEGLITSLDDIRHIVVKTVNGTPVQIADIADTVHIGTQVRYGAATQDGHESVGGIVMMLKGSNPAKVVKRVKDRTAQIEKSLPEGLDIVPYYDRSKLIDRTTHTIAKNLIEGALIVIFVLVILLGSIRGGLITASIIPLSLLFAFICMRLTGVWANLMSLGAIDFGIIVDGAVIIVEGTVQLVEKKVNEGKRAFQQGMMDNLTINASSSMMNSAFFGQIIILIVFAPILFLQGVAGKMFQPMAYTFGFAVIGAIILCLTYVPMVSSLFLRPKPGKKSWFNKLEDKTERASNWLIQKLHKGYHPIISKSLDHKAVVIIAALILFAGAGFTFSRLGGVFIPDLDEGDIVVQALLKPGSALSETVDVTKKIENILQDNFPEVKTVVARIGVADIPTDPMPMDIADMYVILNKHQGQWVSANTKKELIAKMKEKLSALVGVKFVFSQPIELRFNELLTGVREDVAVKLYGENVDVLASKAEKIAQIIKTVPGAAGVRVQATSGLPQIVVDYNRGQIARYGLSIKKLNQLVSTAFAGATAGVIYEGARRFNLVLQLSNEYQRGIKDLRNLYVSLPNGNQIPLETVADISYQPGPMQISRERTHRYTYVGVNVRGRDVESMVQEIKKKLDAQLELPPGYYLDYGGAFENLQQAQQRLKIVVPIALALIFILLFFALGSIAQVLMIYMAVPLATIGGVFALAIRGMPFSISAGVGFIVLFGVAVLNGLVLINRFNSLKNKNNIMSIKERIFIGTKERLRPILLTATAAIMGFFPMAISTSAGAEVQKPLATVVIGGLFSATLLTLIVIPVLYYWVESRNKSRGSTKSPAIAGYPVLFFLLAGVLFLAPYRASAQQQIPTDSLHPISVKEAIQKTKVHYPSVQAAHLTIKNRNALRKTAWDLGMTRIFTGKEEVGNGDPGIQTVIGIEQQGIDPFSISPKLDLRDEQTDVARSALDVTLLKVERSVRNAWYNAYIAKQKLVLHQKLDSIFTEFERAVRLKYEQEVISQLEYLAATNQARQANIKKKQTYQEYRSALTQLNSWLLDDTLYTVPLVNPEKLVEPLPANISSIQNHPLLDRQRSKIKVADAQYDVAKSNFLPTFDVQYGFQEIAGQSGFHSFEIGINIPLFFLPQQGRTKAAKIQKQIAQQNLYRARIELQSTYKSLFQEYQKWLVSWQYYQKEALPLAIKQRKGAVIAYRSGAIDYVTFIQNIQAAIEVETQALDALDHYLNAKARLSYFRQFSNH